MDHMITVDDENSTRRFNMACAHNCRLLLASMSAYSMIQIVFLLNVASGLKLEAAFSSEMLISTYKVHTARQSIRSTFACSPP
jgi:hypothetical protein